MNSDDNIQQNNQIILDSINELIKDCYNKISEANYLLSIQSLNEDSKRIIREEREKIEDIKRNLETKRKLYNKIISANNIDDKNNFLKNAKISQKASKINDILISKNNAKATNINKMISELNEKNYKNESLIGLVDKRKEKLGARLNKLKKKTGKIEDRQRKMIEEKIKKDCNKIYSKMRNKKIENITNRIIKAEEMEKNINSKQKQKDEIKKATNLFKDQKAYGSVAKVYYEGLKTNLRLMGLKAKSGIIKGSNKISEKRDSIIYKTSNKTKEKTNIIISRLKLLPTATFKGFNAFKAEFRNVYNPNQSQLQAK